MSSDRSNRMSRGSQTDGPEPLEASSALIGTRFAVGPGLSSTGSVKFLRASTAFARATQKQIIRPLIILRSSTLTDSVGEFAVELTDIENLVVRLRDMIDAVDRIVSELDSVASAVQSQWTGSAADAYAAAHADWLTSARDLIVEITNVRIRAQQAQSSYVDSISTNLKMLGRI